MSMLNIINISLLKCHNFISAGGFPSFLKRRKIRNQQEIYSPSRRWAFFINVKIKTETELKSVKLSQVNFDLYSEKFMGGIVNIYTSRNNLNNNILPEIPIVVQIGLSMLGNMLNIRSYSYSWSGSKIDYFKEVSKEIQGLGTDYLKHCMLVNEKIKSLEVYKKKILDMTFCENGKNIEKI